jgi:quercetin dioxygenase-like cupin family protein
MEGIKDPRLDVEKQSHHLSRPGFRIAEFTINATQQVPWHCHSNVQDTFYVLEGQIRLFLRDPKEDIRLG